MLEQHTVIFRCDAFKGALQNFHLLVIPMREHHTGEYQYGLVVEVINVI